MPADRTPPPAWRTAETYRPLLGADAAVWAWEFGRRGMAPGAGERADGDRGGEVPDLCFAGTGPEGDPIPAVIWRWQADPSVPVFSVSPSAAGDRDALDLLGSGLAILVVRTSDGGQHVVVSDGPRRLRFAVAEGDVLAGPVRCRYLLPPHSVGVGSLASLRLLVALRDTGRLPSTGGRSPPKAKRWAQILQAHDARAHGASQRDIAMLLFGAGRVRDDWAGRSDYMRMRVQRLLRAAEGLVAGGYRALCGLRPARGDKPEVVEIWRSAAWRGGGLCLLVLGGSFLGTSAGGADWLHGLCQLW
ncbi:DUF2285 domain-containing protein [Caulobacter sp. UNC358MFTsu5.1]|uniref:DUF2285 domain-containing protein n=1 Tax=Caulobacter sp. UNC358MFTsu5.1 TaxID=1449049 RepID=UPI0009E092DB|nr:DUF2285 domain-containing protein [Caulobacter sp. UNC358MFTsu5.1]